MASKQGTGFRNAKAETPETYLFRIKSSWRHSGLFFFVVVVMDMVNRNVYLKLITPDFFLLRTIDRNKIWQKQLKIFLLLVHFVYHLLAFAHFNDFSFLASISLCKEDFCPCLFPPSSGETSENTLL